MVERAGAAVVVVSLPRKVAEWLIVTTNHGKTPPDTTQAENLGLPPLSISTVHGITQTISKLGGVLMALQLHAEFRGSLSLCSKLGKNSKICFFAATEK